MADVQTARCELTLSRHAVTIKDIASELRISHTTVSRALNDRPLISQETKRRVREAAERLGYVPNISARLIRGDTDIQLGLLIPDVQNDFYARISKELADRCRRAGLRLWLAISGDDPVVEENEIRALMEASVSGVFVTLTSSPTAGTISLLSRIPSVQLVRRSAQVAGPAVCMADEAGCRTATEHLLTLGHHRVAYVGTSKTISAGHDRLEGYLQAHKNKGLRALQRNIELVPPRQDQGFDAVARLLSGPDRPTALVIGSSELTIGGLRAINEAGLAIPGDISVAGYGDPVWFELLQPPLTAVSLPVPDIADAAITQMLHEIAHDEPAAEGTVDQVPTELIIRGSTAPPA
jgi:LacI family transcriptional regulator